MIKKKLTDAGFTLIEMLIVVAIIAVLLAVSIPAVMNQIAKAKETVCLANRRNLKFELIYKNATGEMDYLSDMQAYVKASDSRCPAGGVFTVSFHNDKNASGGITITCGIHDGDDSLTGFVSLGLYEKIQDVRDALREGKEPWMADNNDKVRKKFFEIYGENLPTVNIEGKMLYIQPYVAKSSSSDFSATLLYATGNDGNNGNNKWQTSYVYDPQMGKWYKCLDQKGNPVSMTLFQKCTSEEEVKNILNGTNPEYKSEEIKDYKESEASKQASFP